MNGSASTHDKTAAGATAARTPRVRIRNLSKRYQSNRGSVLALNDVSLDVYPAEKVVLLGPSGCGKTTLLRCVAGLETPDEGEIEIDGRIVFSSSKGIMVRPERRDVGMVFQSYALWPHMTVFENVAYPLANLGRNKQEIQQRVAAVLKIVGCDAYTARYPGQLSGGQQQRVALARAIAGNDGTILFDEPLSNIDAKVREQLRVELMALQKELGCSALYVTHDQTEALALAHRIAVMERGRVVQLGPPREVYERPASRYVADFTGTANELDGEVVGAEGPHVRVRTSLGELVVAARTVAAASEVLTETTQTTAPSVSAGQRVCVMIRPEYLRFSDSRSGENSFQGRVESVMFLGLYTEATVMVGSQRLIVRSTDSEIVSEGMSIWIGVQPRHICMFDQSAGAAAPAA